MSKNEKRDRYATAEDTDKRKFIVEWDCRPIGGYVTYHGPFASEDSAKEWISTNINDQDPKVKVLIRRVVPPASVANDEDMY